MLNLQITNLDIPAPPASGERLLYVLLHGLVSIVETADKFHLYLLDMSADHRYLAGTWLAETDVPKGTKAELKGVKKGTASLDPLANPLLKNSAVPNENADGVRGVIIAPKPRRVHSLDRGKIVIASGGDRLVAIPETLSAVRVLEYEIETTFDNVQVISPQFNWTAGSVFTSFPNGSRLATFHVFDMPAGSVPATHHVDEFAHSSTVLGAPITIGSAIPLEVPNPALPPGLSDLEVVGFDARAAEISDLILDFIRTARWVPRAVTGGDCRPCCGGADGNGGN